jgi:hypothetical protein
MAASAAQAVPATINPAAAARITFRHGVRRHPLVRGPATVSIWLAIVALGMALLTGYQTLI